MAWGMGEKISISQSEMGTEESNPPTPHPFSLFTVQDYVTKNHEIEI